MKYAYALLALAAAVSAAPAAVPEAAPEAQPDAAPTEQSYGKYANYGMYFSKIFRRGPFILTHLRLLPTAERRIWKVRQLWQVWREGQARSCSY